MTKSYSIKDMRVGPLLANLPYLYRALADIRERVSTLPVPERGYHHDQITVGAWTPLSFFCGVLDNFHEYSFIRDDIITRAESCHAEQSNNHGIRASEAKACHDTGQQRC